MASTQLSPGLLLERDLTAVANATVDNVAAIVGSFEKGPVELSPQLRASASFSRSSVDPTSITTNTGLPQHNFCCMAAP